MSSLSNYSGRNSFFARFNGAEDYLRGEVFILGIRILGFKNSFSRNYFGTNKNIPIKLDRTKYRYVIRHMAVVNVMDKTNLISGKKGQLNKKNVVNATIGKWIKYIQYDPSEMNRDKEL